MCIRDRIYRQEEDGSGCVFHVSTPKTKAGVRVIPMLDAVQTALMGERMRQMQIGFNLSLIHILLLLEDGLRDRVLH